MRGGERRLGIRMQLPELFKSYFAGYLASAKILRVERDG